MANPAHSIDEQAADWLIRLNQGDLGEAERQQFDAWKRQDPRHAAAAERLQGFVSRLQGLREQSKPVKAALNASLDSRRTPRKRSNAIWLLLLALALPSALWLRGGTPGYWLADLRTGPTQWQTERLQDQSMLTLGGNSAVDISFDAHQRHIELLRGEILVEVAADPSRPFVVETEHGSMRALGTRFLVQRQEQGTVLTMLESKVAAQGALAAASTQVDAGQQARITADQVQLLGRIDRASVADAWEHHQLVVQNQPLPQVLDQLALHRSGLMRFDRDALKDLRVSAVLPLDDPDRALQLIADALPVRVRHFTPWLVVVERQP